MDGLQDERGGAGFGTGLWDEKAKFETAGVGEWSGCVKEEGEFWQEAPAGDLE